MINCVVSGWVDCCSQEYNSDCHNTFYFNFEANFYSVDIEDILCEAGWLYLNEEEALCPVCRKVVE